MKKNINTVHVEGRIYDFDIAVKTAKKTGKEYIGGKISVAVDEEGLNVIDVTFTYVTPYWGNTTKPNSSYPVLLQIINSGKTWLQDGKDNATIVSIDGNLSLNEFISNQTEELVSYKVNSGSFISIVRTLKEVELDRHKFTTDILITSINHVDANEERHIDEDYTTVRGAIFGYNSATKANDMLLPVEFVVKNPQGMAFFEDIEITNEPYYTKVWGAINDITVTTYLTEESAFGAPSVRPSERKAKSYEITGALKIPYEFGDEKILTAEELSTCQQNREIYKAEIRKQYEERKNAPATSDFAAIASDKVKGAPTTKATGDWKF